MVIIMRCTAEFASKEHAKQKSQVYYDIVSKFNKGEHVSDDYAIIEK